MWVSLHPHLNSPPTEARGLFGLMGYQREPLHRICMPLILGEHDAGIEEQRDTVLRDQRSRTEI